MNSYLIHFAAYIFAMIGFIGVMLFIYKKSMFSASNNSNKDFLRIENSIKLSPVKTIYVLRAGNEKFLIAADNTSTTFLAKLQDNVNTNINEHKKTGNERITELVSTEKLIQKLNRG